MTQPIAREFSTAEREQAHKDYLQRLRECKNVPKKLLGVSMQLELNHLTIQVEEARRLLAVAYEVPLPDELEVAIGDWLSANPAQTEEKV